MTLKTQEIHPLSAKQYEILQLYAKGWTYDDIAAHMGCSWHTVKTHLQVAREKLGTHTSFQAVKELRRLEAKAEKARG